MPSSQSIHSPRKHRNHYSAMIFHISRLLDMACHLLALNVSLTTTLLRYFQFIFRYRLNHFSSGKSILTPLRLNELPNPLPWHYFFQSSVFIIILLIYTFLRLFASYIFFLCTFHATNP